MNKELGVGTYEESALVLIDYQGSLAGSGRSSAETLDASI
jgi:hypothetical protein